MAGALSIAALILSATLLAGMIAVLVLLRKGEGPRYGASRAYDANQRYAVRALTGEEVERVDFAQWFEPARRAAVPDDPLAAPYGEAVAATLAAVVPDARSLALEPDGRARLVAEDVTVLPALSTADLRLGLERHGDAGRLVVGLVLFNPEPPGGDRGNSGAARRLLERPVAKARIRAAVAAANRVVLRSGIFAATPGASAAPLAPGSGLCWPDPTGSAPLRVQ
jgi:hypothetical protein